MHGKGRYKIFLCKFFCFYCLHLGAWGQSLSEDDRLKMVKEAGNCVKQYFADLNLITTGDDELRKYRDDDINGTINNYFYSPAAYIYNDLAKAKERDADSLRIREYLEKAYAWYPKGAKFDCSFNVRNPCPQTEKREETRFFVVRVEVAKVMQGIYKFDNEFHTNNDSLDVFIQFVVKQDRPTLVFGEPKIFRIAKHKQQDCPIYELTEDDKKPFQLPDDSEEREWLRQRAVLFVSDFAVTLNVIGNPYINDRFKTTDYFESEHTKVFNDIVPQLRISDFRATEYLENIEKWYQGGVSFKYKNVRATNVLAEFDHVLVEVQADRVLRSYGVGDVYKHRQRLSFMVKFPVVNKAIKDLDKKVVGLERSTPRISAITAVPSRVNPRLYWSIGMQMYSAHYFGDIAPSTNIFSTDLQRTKPAIGIYAMRKLNNHWFAKFSFIAATLSGDDFGASDIHDDSDIYRFVRNLHFRNRIREFTASAVYEFYPNRGKFYARRTFSPYVTFGIGVFRNKPEARTPISEQDVSQRWESLRELGTEGQGRDGYRKLYGIWQPVIPVGVGVRYKLSRRVDICWEISSRLTFTDFIDDVSGDYPNYADFKGDAHAVNMSNRTTEAFSALSLKPRAEGIQAFYDRGGTLITYKGSDNKAYTTMNGYGRAGDRRGNGQSYDYYLFTGFQVHYLLNVGSGLAGQKKKNNYRYSFGE